MTEEIVHRPSRFPRTVDAGEAQNRDGKIATFHRLLTDQFRCVLLLAIHIDGSHHVPLIEGSGNVGLIKSKTLIVEVKTRRCTPAACAAATIFAVPTSFAPLRTPSAGGSVAR